MFTFFIKMLRQNIYSAFGILSILLALGLSIYVVSPEFHTTAPSNSPSAAQKSSVIVASSLIISPAPSELVEITVDLQGAVVYPGVYHLSKGSRISDLLQSAADLSPKADTVWVSRYLNRATILSDGDKIYIPQKGEFSLLPQDLPPSPHQTSTALVLGHSTVAPTEQSIQPANTQQSVSQTTSGKISINHASSIELDSLNGVGAKRAQDIIKGRPYTRIEELTERKIIYKSVFEKIKDQIEL